MEQINFDNYLPEEKTLNSKYLDFPMELRDELGYLDEVLEDYERMVLNIGSLGYSAAMLMYYRDEVQESLEFLKNKDLDISEYWRKISELDNILRANARTFVNETGYYSFKQYQIINDPPKIRWWWYLDRNYPSPGKGPKPWEIWK